MGFGVHRCYIGAKLDSFMSTWLLLPSEPTDEMIEAAGIKPADAIKIWDKMVLAAPRPVMTEAATQRNTQLNMLMEELIGAGVVLGEPGANDSGVKKEVRLQADNIKRQILELFG